MNGRMHELMHLLIDKLDLGFMDGLINSSNRRHLLRNDPSFENLCV